MSEADAGAPAPKIPRPSDLPQWIMAIAAVATFAVAVVALSNSSRLDGIEEYLQSEIALRNRQVMQAEDRAETADRERARAAEDASFSQRQLTYNEFVDVVRGMGATGAYDSFGAQFENPPRALPALTTNPGADLLERIIDHYRDSENPHESRLARRLRSRCGETMNTPLQLAEIPAALPMPQRPESGSRAERAEQYSAAFDQYQRSTREFSEAARARQQAITQAHAAASRALLSCAADILNNQ